MTPTRIVGEPYLPMPVGGWQDGRTIFEWRRDRMELVLALCSPTSDNMESFRLDPIHIGVAFIQSIVYMTHRLGNHVGATPYSIHLLPELDRPDLGVIPDSERRPLVLVLVDAGTGLVRVRRAVWLSRAVEHALCTFAASQAARRWSAYKYDRDVAELRQWGWSVENLHDEAIMEQAIDGAEEA